MYDFTEVPSGYSVIGGPVRIAQQSHPLPVKLDDPVGFFHGNQGNAFRHSVIQMSDVGGLVHKPLIGPSHIADIKGGQD